MGFASSSSVSHWSYDVFLSFRGEDTRRSFVCHLFKQLHRLGINTFKDDQRLETGKSISPQILKAIEESRFSVVVISQNFASSSWCLDELLKIVECMERGSQTVIPIFYEVDPSNVRRQTGSFAEAFVRHGMKSEEKLKLHTWKEALTKIAGVSGEDSRNWKDDSMLIEKVARYILDELNSTPSSDVDYLVGMDAHMNALDALICEGSKDVRMIGICGMGGVGKTTISRYLFNRLSCRFEASCFIEDIKEVSRNYGLQHLRQRLLSKILQEKDLNLTESLGSRAIGDRVGQKKVLLVLDDVDMVDQLIVLAKETNWFGAGSRIIVTTRDKHLLTAHGVELVYKVECLNNTDEALQLFCQFAFRQKRPLDGFQSLAIRAIQSTGGLPLAIRVLGSFLFGRSTIEWKNALEHQLTPPKDVLDVLRISYDGLEDREKVVFLCTTCFFNGEKLDLAMWTLDICGYFSKLGLKVLAEKSLIDVSQGYITMHDLLRQMGRELVRQQSIDEPGKRRFVWDPVDILYLLTNCTGTKAVEGIILDISEVNGFIVSERAFERMHNLKFLKFYNRSHKTQGQVHLPGGLNCLPQKLRLLHWHAFPLKQLPLGFCPENLVELDLRHSNLQKLWEGIQPLWNLKTMDLRWSTKLKQFPDLSRATNLERLDLSFCQSLVEIPPSIQGLYKLTRLSMWGCINLKYLPTKINLRSLKFVNLYDCTSLKRFPELSRNIRSLYLEKTTIKEVPASIGNLTGLIEFHMSDCSRLRSLPPSIKNLIALQNLNLSGCKQLENLPDTIRCVKSLRFLNISGCQAITEFPHVAENTTHLCLNGTSIKEVPPWIGNLYQLQMLDLSRCKPVLISQMAINLSSLTYLSLGRVQYDSAGKPVQCPALSNFPFLEVLALQNLNMPEISSDLGNLSHLVKLDISGNDFKNIPTSINMLSRLKTLYINSCEKLKSLVEFPRSLKRLYADNCVSLESTSQIVNHSLQTLMLTNCFKLDEDAQHMALMPQEKGIHSFACYPWSKCLERFYHEAREDWLLIPLDQTRNIFEHNVFSPCIVVVPKSDQTCNLSIWLLGDMFKNMNFRSGSWDLGVGCQNADLLADHAFLINF